MTKDRMTKELLTIEVATEIHAAHQLALPYPSPCNNVHGHTYQIKVTLCGPLDDNGMVIDFALVKTAIRRYDHQNLNDFFQPSTAERFAMVLRDALLILCADSDAFVVEVAVSETPSTWVRIHA